MRKKVTILDLAKYSGYPRSTISRAFNQSSPIKDSTRVKILKAAAEIGYAPHPGARNIRVSRTLRWGVLVPHLRNPYYSALIEELDSLARERGTSLVIGMTHYDGKLEAAHIQHWCSGETDGAIITVGSLANEAEVMKELTRRAFPTVMMYGVHPELASVSNDSTINFTRAMEMLLTFGHRRIAYMGQAGTSERIVNSYRVYCNALEKAGIPLDEDLMYFGAYERSAGLEAWAKWRQLKERPTAVLGFNDDLTLGVWMGARRDGLQIPRDLSLIGHDDIDDAELAGLTTISHDRVDLARLIFGSLDEQQKSPGVLPARRIVTTQIVMRESVGQAPI